MIKKINNYFLIETKNTSYLLSVDEKTNLLAHHYYGKKIKIHDYEPLIGKLDGGAGTAILYEGKENKFIHYMDLEYSTIGRGDYRESSIILFNEKLGYTFDFKYKSYQIIENNIVEEPIPHSKNYDQVLIITLKDEVAGLKLELYYKVFEEYDVISKYCKLINESSDTYIVERLMSSQIDFKDGDFTLMTFDGNWGKERHVHERDLTVGIYTNDSKMGISSNMHNPLTILKRKKTTENQGIAYGFNLIYSGNHQTFFEVSINNKLRVLSGMSFYAYKKNLKENESFMTPESIITFSSDGLNGLSHNFHEFTLNCIIPSKFKNYLRPIVINNWEATYFNFDEEKLLKLAKVAKKLGIEMFVLDDGWFGHRDNDRSSLGDFYVNSKKLPHGLKYIVDKVNKIGLDFGLWFEPEMISEDSDLYRKHPDWAVKVPRRKPSIGRNQLVLDLTKKEVQDYLIDEISKILSLCNIKYVKWDFNRPITDMYSTSLSNNGEFFHEYIQGLYRILDTLTKRFSYILFEGCASGGNRFDLGMLCYMPQTWTSDNTDYYERLFIQTGTTYGYPLSSISNHVSSIPNHQTLRKTPLASRFHLACLGVLGYELNLLELTSREQKEIKKQIEFYKKYRHIFQYGTLYRSEKTIFNSNVTTFTVVSKDKKEAVVILCQGLVKMAQQEDVIYVDGLDNDTLYEFYNLKHHLNIKMFGGLLNVVSPIKVKINGVVYKAICYFYKLKGEVDHYKVYGSLLKNAGIRLSSQFLGTGYSQKVRVMSDFGSRLYLIKEVKDED